MKKITLLFVLAFFMQNIQAQLQWEMGAFTGVASYTGEYSKNAIPTIKDGAAGFGVMGRYVHSYKWAVRGGIYVGKLKGDDFGVDDAALAMTRAGSFSTNFTEITFLGEWEPMGEKRYLSGSGFKRLISPYFFAGLGLVAIKPRADFSQTTGSSSYLTLVEEDINAKFLKGRFVVPFGVGIKIDLSEYWNIGLELGGRYTFTDYLDGTSHAGDPSSNDWYFLTGASVFYRLKDSMRR